MNFVYQPVRNARNQITGLFCEGYDVTVERVAADELAALQAQLIHVSRVNAMGAMATTLAHELNQPLAAISSYVAGCQRLIDPHAANADKLRDALVATEEASQRAGSIIHHLRDLTRRGAPTNISFNLRAAIAECVRLLRIGRTEALDIVNDTPDGVIMIADRVQIQQVVINLLCNAAEATVTADRDRISIGAEIAADRVTVSVTDTGGGVSADVAQGIFSWSASSKEGGMGLGLSISRTIVERHGGRIWLERSDPTGSTFCFSLPREAPVPDSEAAAHDG